MSVLSIETVSGDRSSVSKRVLRVLSLVLEVGLLILLALSIPTAIGQVALFPLWWTVAAFAVTLVPALVLLAVNSRAQPPTLQLICGIQASAYLVVLLAVPVALMGHKLPAASGLPWPVQLSMIAAAAAGVGWGVRRAVAYFVGLQVTVFGLVFVSVGDPSSGATLGDAVFDVFYVALLVVLAFALRRASVLLDLTVESAVIEARASATAEATRTARRRVAALIHDSVIVALLTYSNRTGTDATAVAEARSALEAMANLDKAESPQDSTPVDFAWELQALTTEHDPEAVFDYVVESEIPVPAVVVEAIGEATSEALRNSIQHARVDAPVVRQVRVMVSDDLVEVVVLDDGDGFDLSAVRPARLGIRHGIIARLDAVPGGSARVTSTPGYGTIVALHWTRR